jgi:CRP-like cAMP-binding protein
MSTTAQASRIFLPGQLEKESSALLFALHKSALFKGMTNSEIEGCLTCSTSREVKYQKGDTIFYMDDKPQHILVLLSGSVIVGRDTMDGRRIIMNTFDRPGDLFGEVYLFVNREEYNHFAEAQEETRILMIPKEFLSHTCGNGCRHHTQLILNTLTVLAQKADYLSERVTIMSSSSLRQKIARVLLDHDEKSPGQPLAMTREQLAQYIAATRPSVSRELMNMKDDGLVKVDKRGISIGERQALEDLVEE